MRMLAQLGTVLSVTLAAAACTPATAPKADAPATSAAAPRNGGAPSALPPDAAATATKPTAADAGASAAVDLDSQVPDIEYVPTPQNVVDKLLDAATIKKDDVLYDLGCGDGRIVINAAKRFGIKAIGFDIDPKRVAESKENVKRNKVEHLVTIEQKDIFTVDLTGATVVTLYLLPELNVRLIPQLEKLRPGSRIVSHDFDMQGVEPVQNWTVIARDHQTPKDREHYVYLWKTPLKKTPAAPATPAASGKPAAATKPAAPTKH